MDSVNTQTGVVVLDADDISDSATTNKFATAAELAEITANTAKNSYPSADSTKVGHLSVTQDVNLDTVESDVAAMVAMRDNGRLMVRKISVVQASTSSWADLVSWAAADEAGSDFAFSAVSGIVEINTTGDYEITYSVLGTNTVANRASLEVRLMRDTGGGYAEVTNTKRGAYARLNTTHQFAAPTLPAFHKALSDGDLLKLQVQHTGNVLNCTGHIHIRRVG